MPTNYMTMSRQALYDLIWSKPLQQVAKELGVSDLVLKERCYDISVPVPPADYWARIQAGQTPQRPTLPKFRARSGLPADTAVPASVNTSRSPMSVEFVSRPRQIDCSVDADCEIKKDWRRLREVEEFRGNWNWQSVFFNWKARLGDFALDPLNLFVKVSVHDPAHPTNRPPELSWWPAHQVRERQEYIQQHFLEWPGTRGPIHRDNQRKGELDTLLHLYEFRHDAENVAAVLIAASLFARLRSSRRNFPGDAWPPFRYVEVLEEMAYQRWQGEQFYVPWADTCTVVLPYVSCDQDYSITNLGTLVRYLAEEHAAVFSQFRPVIVDFSAECDAFIEKKYRDRKQADAERARQWDLQWKQQLAKQEQERMNRKRPPVAR